MLSFSASTVFFGYEVMESLVVGECSSVPINSLISKRLAVPLCSTDPVRDCALAGLHSAGDVASECWREAHGRPSAFDEPVDTSIPFDQASAADPSISCRGCGSEQTIAETPPARSVTCHSLWTVIAFVIPQYVRTICGDNSAEACAFAADAMNVTSNKWCRADILSARPYHTVQPVST